MNTSIALFDYMKNIINGFWGILLNSMDPGRKFIITMEIYGRPTLMVLFNEPTKCILCQGVLNPGDLWEHWLHSSFWSPTQRIIF